MRNYLYILFGIIFFVSFTGTKAKAQQKIGYVNSDTILNRIPEYKGVQQQLSKIGEGWRRQISQMQQKIDTLEKDFKAKKILYSDKLRAKKKRNINKLMQKKNQYIKQKFGADGDYFKKQKQLLKPIQQKVFKAISIVAQQQNMDFVLDRANNSTLLYSRTKWNLNNDVLQQLGITLNNQTNQQ